MSSRSFNYFLKIFHGFIFDKICKNYTLSRNFKCHITRACRITLDFWRILIYYYNMYKALRIIFCIVSVIAAASAVFVIAYFNWWGLIPVAVCIVCASLMFLFKRLQENRELKENPPPPEGDFITGRVTRGKGEDENE